MRIDSALNQANAFLLKFEIESPRLDAEVILASLLNCDRVFLYTHPDYRLEESLLKTYKEKIIKRSQHKPIAYIIGYKEFMGLKFFTNDSVLIPRPDTEILVENALSLIRDNAKVLDLCTGSGAIGLSLAKYKPSLDVTLSDISQKALEITLKNKEALEIEAQIIQSDLFENISDHYDLIISNPPYIPSKKLESLAPDIYMWEPKLALNGGENGYHFYTRIIDLARNYLKEDGILMLESGDSQSEELSRLFENAGYEEITVLNDLTLNPRVVYGYWNRMP